MNQINMDIIARMKSDFPTKFGIPRQSGLVKQLQSTIIFEPDYRNADALRGLEEYSHIWIIWQFSEAIRDKWSPTVRPPRLGGNTRMGVFATRSPFRPNAIGLSCVELIGLEQTKDYGMVIHIAGADLMDGTPILDIKPYLPYSDCHTNATGGFTTAAPDLLLQVNISQEILDKVAQDKQDALLGVLSHDPRPAYQKDNNRIYGLSFSNYDIHFTVENDMLTVLDIVKRQA